MDINMPKMDGMECSRQIRALEDDQKAKTPIIAITEMLKTIRRKTSKQLVSTILCLSLLTLIYWYKKSKSLQEAKYKMLFYKGV